MSPIITPKEGGGRRTDIDLSLQHYCKNPPLLQFLLDLIKNPLETCSLAWIFLYS